MKTYLYLAIILVLFSACEENSQREVFYKDKLKLGDNPAWSAKHLDVSDWEERADFSGQGIFWIRLEGELSEVNNTRKNQGIKVGGTGAYQLWMDGVYLGQNGELQTATTDEKPGTYQAFFPLPDSLSVGGKHVFAFRMTKQHLKPGQHLWIVVDDYFTLIRKPLQISKYMFLFGGVFILTAIYFLFVFASRPKEFSPLIFSLICFIFCGLLTLEYLKLFYLYEYPFQRTRLEIIGWCHMFLGVLVPLFFMLQFSFPYKKALLAVVLLSIFLIDFNYHYFFDWKAIAHNKVMWSASFFIVAYGIYEHKNGAKMVLTAIFIAVLLIYVSPSFNNSIVSDFDVSQFIAFVILVLCMLYLMTIRRREERLAYEASLVLSERLKNELLKKNIKPHFIMNTLTSLIDWVEEAPKEGVKFITALAGEFEVLNEIADHQLVPIEQEIKLCKNHLKVMGYRKEIEYKWEEKGIDVNEIIPPAIIHTAVENGVTHSLPDAHGVVLFRLIFEKKEKTKTYILQTLHEIDQ